MEQVNIETLQKLVMVMLNPLLQSRIPTEEEVRDYANRARGLCPVTDEEFNEVLKNLYARLLVTMDTGVYIIDPNTNHQSWLPNRRADINFYYWNRYKDYLEIEKGWNSNVVSTLDKVSDEIIDLFGDPSNEDPWQRRGLIIGDVQSGKTANYTAICNKAADAGYKVIILLTGTLENLRKQTQDRLDSDFVGRKSKYALSREIKNIFYGVGKIDSSRFAMTFTSEITDFNMNTLTSLGLDLKNCVEPAVFVVKKNKTVLKNLERWLRLFNANHHGIIDIPMLLIDDEADNASINTKSDDDPTAINGAIRKLLHQFSRSTYVGVTATPFANIFIHPEDSNEMIGDDLFPSDFIYVLSPPSNYIGSHSLFGDESTHEHNLVPLKDVEGYFPSKHKITHLVNAIPPSLEEALYFFVLANAIRDYRGHKNTHRSMMINVSRFSNVQDQITRHIDKWLQNLRSDVQNYSKLPVNESVRNKNISSLKKVWEKYNLEDQSGVQWEEIQMKYLKESLMPIEARSVNKNTGAASLDYQGHKEKGLRVVAVGGLSLSRGLTLEGLCVSYFYRNSKMYDTLMQMGRWFGYRDGYDDLFRIWMTDETVSWYEHIHMASEELKEEIRRMNRRKMTPREFGLKVREHPETQTLIITAKNKMKNTKHFEGWISVSGRLLETPRLSSKLETVEANETAAKTFIQDIIKCSGQPQRDKNDAFWNDVPKKEVVRLLNDFTTHPWHMSFQSRELAEFIENADHLPFWDVVIPSGTGDFPDLLNGFEQLQFLKKEKRKIAIARDGAILISGTKVRVGSKGATKFGLTKQEIEQAEQLYREEGGTKENPPENAYLVQQRKPLLFLHFVEPQLPLAPEILQEHPLLESATLVALGIGFPRFDEYGSRKIKYVLNLVEVRNLFGYEEEDDEDEE